MAGLVLTVVAAVLLLFGLWVEPDSDLFWKITVSLLFFAAACSQLSLLFMTNLAGGYRWAYVVAYQLVLGLAAILTCGVVFDQLERNEGFMRLTGVVAILVAAITLLFPVFHRLSRDQAAVAQAEADPLFAVESEIAATKKRLMDLENKRRILLGRLPIETGTKSD